MTHRGTVLTLNGLDEAALRDEQVEARQDPAAAERRPQLTAHWVGGTRARVEAGPLCVYFGGEGDFGAMRALLAALAACYVDIIATHATLMNVPLEALSVQAEGAFNAAAYLGVAEAPPPGYRGVRLVVTVHAPGITAEQLARLRHQLEHGSPVGDSLARAVPLTLALSAAA